MKKNCWEVMKCGREPGGSKVAESGVCLAAIEVRASGIHGGHNAGRCCWAITGTLCHDHPHGTFVQKFKTCTTCPFYKIVTEEEDRYLTVEEIEKIIRSRSGGGAS